METIFIDSTNEILIGLEACIILLLALFRVRTRRNKHVLLKGEEKPLSPPLVTEPVEERVDVPEIESFKELVAPPKEEKKEEKEELTKRLSRSRQGLLSKLRNLVTGGATINPELLEELEMILITSDIGVSTTQRLLKHLKEVISGGVPVTQDVLLQLIKEELVATLTRGVESSTFQIDSVKNKPAVLMIVGVNGAGKTTTIAKLGKLFKEQGKKVVLAAADTFRAAAVDQLEEWAKRLEIEIVSGKEGAKPSSVAFDGLTRAREVGADLLIIDTAGRLHNKGHLMQELTGISNAIKKIDESAPHETLLVVDGTSGQNALVQAKEFTAATALTGVVVTKLDGTSKGGIVVAIKEELGIPVRFVGVGEGMADLREFDASEFTSALLNIDGSELVSPENTGSHAMTRRRRRASS